MANSQTSKTLWWKTLTCLILALTLSLTLFISACSKDKDDTDDGSDDTEVEEVIDPQIIKNANFEYVDFKKDDDGNDEVVFPATSVKNWSKSYLATRGAGETNPTSAFDSGIIDTTKISSQYLTFSKEQEAQLASLEGIELSVRTRGESEPETNTGNNVLMLANKYEDTATDGRGRGTAMRFTSQSTLTLLDGYAYKISVWVRTNALFDEENPNDKSLKNYDGQPVDGKAGAYIGLTTKLGSTTVSPFHIKNIDTNGEWQQFSLYVKGSDFSSSTVTLVLGLGYGSAGTSKLINEYVEGYAFFDDITYEIIPIDADAGNESFNKHSTDVYSPFKNTGKDMLILDESKVSNYADATDILNDDGIMRIDLAAFTTDNGFNTDNLFDTLDSASYNIDRSKTESDGTVITAPEDASDAGWSGIFTLDALKNVTHGEDKPYDGFFKDYPFSETDSILMLRARNSSAYTFDLTDNGDSFVLAPDTYYAVSFYVRTTKITFGAGATLTVIDKGVDGTDKDDYVKTSFSAIDTNTLRDEDDETPDYFNGWTKYTFFIKNGTSNSIDANYSIELNFGLTTQTTDKNQYNSGWAAFTGYFAQEVSEAMYSAAAEGSFIKKVTLTAGDKAATGPNFDNAMAGDKFDAAGEENIKTRPVALANYSSVKGGTTRTGGDKKPAYGDYTDANILSGLMDSKYLSAYSAAFDGLLDGLFPDSATLPIKFLGIYNKTANTYGYISKNATSLSSNGYAYISLDVYLSSPSSKAFIYLTNPNYEDKYSVFGINRPEVKDGETQKYSEEEGKLYHEISYTGANPGWINVRFYIATGDDGKSFNIELWNGSRDGAVTSAGLVLFRNLNVNTSSTQAVFENVLESSETNLTGTLKFIRQPDKFYDEENGSSELIGTYEEKTVYGLDSTNNRLFADLSDIDVTVIVEDDTVDDGTDTETPVEKPKANIWLLLSSMILALALIGSLVMVLIRKLKQRISKRKIASTTRYSSKKKHYSSKDIGEDLDINDDTVVKAKDAQDGDIDSDDDDII